MDRYDLRNLVFIVGYSAALYSLRWIPEGIVVPVGAALAAGVIWHLVRT